MLAGFALYVVAFFLYLELKPGLGQFFVRTNDRGRRVIDWQGMWNILCYPWTYRIVWHPRFVDLNWMAWAAVGCIAEYLIISIMHPCVEPVLYESKNKL